MDPSLPLIGPRGQVTLLDAFEGRQQLIAYYFMWWNGHPAAEQCEGCTHYTTQVGELSYLHSRDVTYATFCQGPYEESIRYRDFMGWEMPWYSAEDSLETLLVGREVGKMHVVCYLRDGERVFETYWTTRRGVEAMDYSYGLLWAEERLPLVKDRIRDRLVALSARLGDADWLDGDFSAGDLMMVSVLLRL